MKRKKFFGVALPVVVSIIIVCGKPNLVFAETATEILKGATDKIIDIVTDEKLKNDKKLRMSKLHQVIDPVFSYEQMSMRSLAKNWKQRTPEEQKEFIRLFSKLLENSYASKLESYGKETINYLNEKVKGNYAMVKTEIIRSDGPVAIDYKFFKQRDDWMIYDFVIEGVSMVQNYRSQFNRIIKKESYEALRKKLDGKVTDLES